MGGALYIGMGNIWCLSFLSGKLVNIRLKNRIARFELPVKSVYFFFLSFPSFLLPFGTNRLY